MVECGKKKYLHVNRFPRLSLACKSRSISIPRIRIQSTVTCKLAHAIELTHRANKSHV